VKKTLMAIFLIAASVSGFSYNWGEILQKAVYFYECQQAGPLMSGNRVEWRGNATMNDGVKGGWYDAGDHVKFNLPMAFSASMLGWAEYEYKSALSSSGQLSYYEANLKFVLDYLASCWNGSTYTYQVGDGNNDHTWWGPVECIEKETMAGNRPVATATSNAGCVMGQTAAALAIGSILFNNSTYLSKAKQLYAKADADRSDSGYTAANNFYTSNSGPIDECMWAACWLYLATNDSSYLTKAESYVPLLKLEPQTTSIEYKWAHCWDDSHYGAMLLLARITGKSDYKSFIETHLDWWSAGAKGKTPKGLSWLDSWGSLRYASASAFVAFVYSDWTGADSAKATSYKNWAISQLNYIAGDNERSGSYVVGFGTNAPKHPHHRTAHGSWCDSQQTPANHRHTLYGALVGGPDQSGGYTDEIGNYTTNEVACDYNAGFTASSIKMFALSGGTPLSGFPAPETKDDEFFCEAKIGGTQTSQTDITIFCNNRSGWPARMIKNLSFRYFMDLSEVSNPAGVTATTNYLEFPATITGPVQWSGSIYYFQVSFNDGTNIYPGGMSEYSAEVQLRLTAPSGSSWDPANDPSLKGLASSATSVAPQIPVYDGTSLIYGTEPGGSSPSPTQVPATPEVTVTATQEPGVLLGDVNTTGAIDIVDALLVAQYYVGSAPANFNVAAADVTKDGSVDIVDALRIAQCYVGLISCSF
jgi:endoglucanase